jgi:hypothetical protein
MARKSVAVYDQRLSAEDQKAYMRHSRQHFLFVSVRSCSYCDRPNVHAGRKRPKVLVGAFEYPFYRTSLGGVWLVNEQ